MHDLKSIRADPASFDAGLSRRALPPRADALLALDRDRRAAQTELQTLQAERNEVSRRIGQLKSRGEPAGDLVARVGAIKDRSAALEDEDKRLAESVEQVLASLPNLPAPEVPDGPDETANREVRRRGAPRIIESARQHFELGEALGLMDFGRAARIAGARFTVLTGALARLERALGAFMLDVHTAEFGYTEVSPPLLVNDQAAFGTGQLPKFAEDLFRTTDGRWLIPTAEVSLTNLVADEILDEDRLPLRFTAFTPCFRSEAGSAGRDTRGMIRQHQFHKVELVSIAHPEQSDAEHERMTACAESILQRLDLAYRVMLLSTGDMGFTARKTYYLEVWLPGQGAYREISSCSNCGDFQARRMKARFRGRDDKQTRFVHTLNGSGLAVPAVLRPYVGGLERIAR